MKSSRIVLIGIASGLTVLSSPVFAQWYGSVSAGNSSTSFSDPSTPAGVTASSVSKDDNDTGYKIQGGYQFNPNWGVEFGYVNLGKFNTVRNVTAPVVGFARGDGKADGWNAIAVGTLPLSNGFSLIGKLGTIYSTAKLNASVGGALVAAPGTTTSWKKSDWGWTYGLGLQYDINQKFSVRGDWDRYDGLKSGATAPFDKFNFDLLSIGLKFKF